ncbi:DUF5044 domain-containing protein [Flavonifractor plautii]|nr:DUF5044 domain-containing protein [Flavonifractor plautii]
MGTLRRAGPFWEPVRFNAVQPDDALPITLLFEDAGMAHSFLCVLSSDPQIVTMELDYVAGFSKTSSSPQQLRTLRREAVEHCFLFPCDGSAWVPVDDPFQSIRLRGYDTAGNLVYESPCQAFGRTMTSPQWNEVIPWQISNLRTSVRKCVRCSAGRRHGGRSLPS